MCILNRIQVDFCMRMNPFFQVTIKRSMLKYSIFYVSKKFYSKFQNLLTISKIEIIFQGFSIKFSILPKDSILKKDLLLYFQS